MFYLLDIFLSQGILLGENPLYSIIHIIYNFLEHSWNILGKDCEVSVWMFINPSLMFSYKRKKGFLYDS